jgi:tetratricopeptide (TPR) repeat protein
MSCQRCTVSYVRSRFSSSRRFSSEVIGSKSGGETRLNGAIADYDQAIKLNPMHANSYSNRGLAESDKGDLRSALADYNKAVELSPNSFQPYINRGIVKSKADDVDGAKADFSKAVELNSRAQKLIEAQGYSLDGTENIRP